MSYTPHDICTWAGRQKVGSSKAKSVLNALALWADRMTWECWPSFALIAEYTEIPERSVSRALIELESRRFISRERIRRRDGSLAGWRFKLNPDGVDFVVAGKPAVSAADAESASEEADEPPANLAGGDQDMGERDANDAQNVQTSHLPNQPGGENTIVVKLASPAANGGRSIGTTTENDSPLPPENPPADRSPAVPASGGGPERPRQPHAMCGDPPILDAASEALQKFRREAERIFGAAAFRAWLDDVRILEEAREPGPPPRVTLRLSTASAACADRIGAQMTHRLTDVWRVVAGIDADAVVKVSIEVDPVRAKARADDWAKRSADESAGKAKRARRRA